MSWTIVEHEGKAYRLAVVRTARGVWVGWPGGALLLRPEGPGGDAATVDHGEVRAPMTGRIVGVRVAPGARVREKEILVILEAMKMEYRLAAPRAGFVEEVLCKEGDLVDLGAALVRLGAPEAAGAS